jgi:hypothetical protein
MVMRLLIEALVVGIVLAIVITLAKPTSIPALILTGALIHLGFEISGANSWYCKRGFACS